MGSGGGWFVPLFMRGHVYGGDYSLDGGEYFILLEVAISLLVSLDV